MSFKKILDKKRKEFEKKKTNVVNISEYVTEGKFFSSKKLTYHEAIYLLNKKFKVVYQKNLDGENEYYLINPPLNESLQHFFLVQLIKEVLEKNNLTVKEYGTKEPDLVFRIKNKFVALEIETGKILTKNKKRFLEKVNTLNQNYGEDWFIIVTNRNFSGKYRKFGKTLTRKNFLKKLSKHVRFTLK